MNAYYNEFEKYPATWLTNLIDNGLIADGAVDTRSIVDVKKNDVMGKTQVHWFAGIGTWSYALRLAGWPDTRPVWTASLPCQPWSTAGKGGKFEDERHLWPVFFRLVEECRPAVLFGEQVSSKDGLEWFSAVQADLESAGYAVAAIDACAAGVGAPHIRQRLFWMAYDYSKQHENSDKKYRKDLGQKRSREAVESSRYSCTGRMEYTDSERFERGLCRREDTKREAVNRPFRCNRSVSRLANHDNEQRPALLRPLSSDGYWKNSDWLFCQDGKWRPVEPKSFPLADGITSRVGKLRAYGNAIVAPLAAAFIASAMQAIEDME